MRGKEESLRLFAVYTLMLRVIDHNNWTAQTLMIGNYLVHTNRTKSVMGSE